MLEPEEIDKARTVAEMIARDFRLRKPGDLEELFQYFFERSAVGVLWDEFHASYIGAVGQLDGEVSLSVVIADVTMYEKPRFTACGSINFAYASDSYSCPDTPLELLDMYVEVL